MYDYDLTVDEINNIKDCKQIAESRMFLYLPFDDTQDAGNPVGRSINVFSGAYQNDVHYFHHPQILWNR